ncbi:MAG: TA system VapC family ribonuclease toxin [Actinomycetes bacterium]
MLLDANVLIYAVDSSSPHHLKCRTWLEANLNQPRRVALPWQSIGAFLRITTHPRVVPNPLTSTEAWQFIGDWISAAPVWVPPITPSTLKVLGELMTAPGATGNLVPDAMLAAIAIEHGLTVVTADSDFTRFPVTMLDPTSL